MSPQKAKKFVYSFGMGKAEGNAEMKNLLGGKGANLAEMCRLGLPVPAGFTITTECCVEFFNNRMKFPSALKAQVEKALAKVEREMGMKFGDPKNPLLVSCRSGARKSMPGMMETVLNVGLCSKTIPGLIEKTRNERFVYDAYRRLIMMYSDVVMEKAEGIEPAEGKGIRVQLEEIMNELKKQKSYKNDTDLTAEDLKDLCAEYKKRVKQSPRQAVPGRRRWNSSGAASAPCSRAGTASAPSPTAASRAFPHEWGTAVERPGDGLRQHGRHLGHRRGLHAQPGHRREQVLRRMAGQRPGRGRRGRHPHAAPAERGHQERAEPAPAVAREGDARGSTSSSTTSRRSWRSTTRTCRTSSSRSRKASSTCCRRRVGQAHRHGGAEHGHGHAGREADRREDRGHCA